MVVLESIYQQFVTGIAVLARQVPGGRVEARDGVTVTAVGRGGDEFNTAWVSAAPCDLRGTLAWAADELRSTGRSWKLQVPDALGLELDNVAEELGLAVFERVPAMALDVSRADPTTSPPDLVVRRVEDAQQLEAFRRAMTVGFGGPDRPSDPAQQVITEALLDDPRLAFISGTPDGSTVPVATAVGVTEDGVTGIYGVTTTPAYRRRGYGEAVTWAAVAAGAAAGGEVAVLQASAMGEPVYARMGFRTLTEYRRFGPAAT